MIVALLGTFLLLCIQALGKCTGSTLRLLLPVGVLATAIWLIAVNLGLPLERSYEHATTIRVARYGAEKVSAFNLGEYVFLIEGSSLTSCGLDGAEVEKKLMAAGVSATVVQVSVPGANHAARLEVLRELGHRLEPKQWQALRTRKVILCHEISAFYDNDPLTNLPLYAFTPEALSYVSPENLGDITDWITTRFNFKTIRKKKLALVGLVLQHEFFNLFRINYLTRISEPSTQGPLNGHMNAPGRDPKFPRDHVLGFPDHPPPRLDDYYGELQRWVRKRDSAYRRVLRNIVRQDLIFTLPDWWDGDYFYDQWHRRNSPLVFFSGNERAIRLKLGDPNLWADIGHLEPAGAEIYSNYFANFLIQKVRAGLL